MISDSEIKVYNDLMLKAIKKVSEDTNICVFDVMRHYDVYDWDKICEMIEQEDNKNVDITD